MMIIMMMIGTRIAMDDNNDYDNDDIRIMENNARKERIVIVKTTTRGFLNVYIQGQHKY